MALLFDTWDQKAIDAALTKRKVADIGVVARRFFEGDHWQGGAGWVGATPAADDPTRTTVMEQIKAGFVFENAVKAVTARHVAGVLGREPRFAMAVRRPLKTKEETGGDAEAPSSGEQALIAVAEAAITGEFWDKRKPVKVLRDALTLALLQGRSVLRIYIPNGVRQPNGTVAITPQPGQEPIEAALNYIYFDALSAEQAQVYTDDDTKRQVGVFKYKTADDKDATELTYLAEDNVNTNLRVVTAAGGGAATPIPLHGRLLMFEIDRDALITDGVLSLQKAINHARTMVGRNVNMAGFRERTFTGAVPPGEWVDNQGQVVDEDTPGAVFRPAAIPFGAGATAFLVGAEIKDADGNVAGYTDPRVTYAEPVDPTPLIKVIDSSFAALLHEVNQKHIAISGDAMASGESRKQARAEYADDLRVSKGIIDEAGRWLIETTLHLAAWLVNAAGRFDPLRPEFACFVNAGPISAEEEKSLTERHEKGLLSAEGAMERQGVEDVAAELARIAAERSDAQARENEGMAQLAAATRTAPQRGADGATVPAGRGGGTPNGQRAGSGAVADNTGGTTGATGDGTGGAAA